MSSFLGKAPGKAGHASHRSAMLYLGPDLYYTLVCITPSSSTVLERRAQYLNSRQFLQDGEGRTCCMMAPPLQKALINKD
jgi:hypothetical protein